jgi:hypothetical protein
VRPRRKPSDDAGGIQRHELHQFREFEQLGQLQHLEQRDELDQLQRRRHVHDAVFVERHHHVQHRAQRQALRDLVRRAARGAVREERECGDAELLLQQSINPIQPRQKTRRSGFFVEK